MGSSLDKARARAQKTAPSRNGKHSKPPPAAGGNEPKAGLVTTCLATISPRPVEWVVPGYVPLGKLLLLAGDGGHGKSTITLHGAACTTRGLPWFGLDYSPPPPAEVLLVSCEDDYADTVVPRLLAAGADLARIHKVDGIVTDDGKPAPFSLAHYEAMGKELATRTEVRLVVIDPAGAYVGRSGVDDHKDSELRSLLDPLAEMAARHRVTVLIVKHIVKGTTAKAVHKVSGSAGYVNSVRAAYLVAHDPQVEDRRLLMPIKFNIAPKPRALAYRLEAVPADEAEAILTPFGDLGGEDRGRLAGQLCRVSWQGAVDADADDVMADKVAKDRSATKPEKAAEWLLVYLSSHAYPSDEVVQAGKAEGFSRDTLFKARDLVGKARIPARKMGRGQWFWGLGDPANWSLRPEPSQTHDDGSDRSTLPTVPTLQRGSVKESVASEESVALQNDPAFRAEYPR